MMSGGVISAQGPVRVYLHAKPAFPVIYGHRATYIPTRRIVPPSALPLLGLVAVRVWTRTGASDAQYATNAADAEDGTGTAYAEDRTGAAYA
jgi:hypothetical protein